MSDSPTDAPRTPPAQALKELIPLFLRLGFTAFGGPAAHIAMYHDEVVKRRKWMTEQHFLDLLGATNLIPGPNSTEMAIHIGFERAGWRGLVAAGVCFILPASMIVLVLAVLYENYGTTPAAEWLLYGIKPVIIAVVIQAIWGLLGKAVRTRFLALLGVVAFALYLAGVDEIALLFGSGALALVVANANRLRRMPPSTFGILAGLPAPVLVQAVVAASPVSLPTLFLTFFKIGAVLYGSGYVLLAFLRTDLVERLGWLTNTQLLDAVAIGQFTPGPVFTTATFIGYILSGVPGAVLATVGIFLPSFIFVMLLHPFVSRVRSSPWLAALLDGVNVAALALMAAVTLELATNALVDVLTVLLAIAAAVLLIRFRVNSTWLIIGGGLVGLVSRLLAG